MQINASIKAMELWFGLRPEEYCDVGAAYSVYYPLVFLSAVGLSLKSATEKQLLCGWNKFDFLVKNSFDKI